MVKISALAALLPFLMWEQSFAATARCDSNKFMAQLKPTGALPDPDVECANNKGAKCQFVRTDKLKPGESPGACEMVYKRIKDTIDAYQAKVNAYCTQSNAKLDQCEALVGRGTLQQTCMAEHANETAVEETKLAQELMEAQNRLLVFEEAATEAKKKYLGFWDRIKPAKVNAVGLPHLPPIAPHSSFPKDDFECGGKPDSVALWKAMQPSEKDKPETSPMISEQVKAIKYSEAFRKVAFTSAKKHQDTTTAFKGHAKKFEELARKGGSVDPNSLKGKDDPNKSDITKSDQKAPPPGGGAPPGGGGGGSPGGGQGGGSSGQAQDQGGFGATAGTPGSLNTPGGSGKDPLKDSSTKPGKGGSRTADGVESPVPIPKAEALSGSFLGGSSLGPSSSRALSGDRTGGSGSKAASAKSSGGGGGGGLGDSGGDKPCLGKDCQQALGNLKNGQFAPVGSLGGGGGMGFDADSGSLDSLFKTDEAKKDGGEPGSLDGLASLDAGLDAAGSSDEDGAGVQGSGGEIDKSDGRDLFLRVRSYHLRALKRGLLVGVPKKL